MLAGMKVIDDLCGSMELFRRDLPYPGGTVSQNNDVAAIA